MQERINKTRGIFNKVQEVVKNKEKIFYLNTFILAVLFLVVNFLISSVMNIDKFNDYTERNLQLKLEIKDSVSIEKIQDIEKELLQDKKVNYIKYIPKEIAFKNLEDSLDMELGSENPLSNSMLVYLKNIKKIEEIEKIENDLSQKEEIHEIISKKDYIKSILSFKRNLVRITRAISLFLIIPLVLLFYFVFGLNFSYLEEELKIKFKTSKESHKLTNMLPYFITKVFTLVAGWLLSLLLFIPFYREIIWQIYEINPFITLTSIKEMYSPLFYSLLIALVLLVFAGLFFRDPAKPKRKKA